jgi:gamma-glutamyltranspeptidase/glutathione hydrolase
MAVQVAHGVRGIVASGHALATDAALSILKKGGNAVDAAICGAFVLTVTCPYACSLAGDMYMLVFDPKDGAPGGIVGLNATGCAPAAASIDRFPDGMPRNGVRSATVPGFLAGAADALTRFGTISLADAITPALALAEDGFAIHPYFTKNIDDRKSLLSQDPAASALFLPDGEALKPGAHFVQTDVATILRLIASEGIDVFYRGSVAERIVSETAKLGGLLTEGDFAAHSSLWQKPISAPFRGHDIWTMPPNSYGATLLLQLIELESNGTGDCDPDGLDFVLRGYAARKKAYAAAAKFIADPALGEAPVERILQTAIAGGQLSNPQHDRTPEAADSSTTNIVVIDETGMAVSLIESISTPFGAGVVPEGTGIVLNNRIGGFNTDPASLNCIAPGKRPAHTLAPCLVTKEGKLAMAVGTPGTVGQTCTLAQLLVRILACGQPPEDAIVAARWSADFQGKLIVEDTMAKPLMEAALAQGAQTMPAGWISFGSIKLAMPSQNGLAGFADDRRSATAAGF